MVLVPCQSVVYGCALSSTAASVTNRTPPPLPSTTQKVWRKVHFALCVFEGPDLVSTKAPLPSAMQKVWRKVQFALCVFEGPGYGALKHVKMILRPPYKLSWPHVFHFTLEGMRLPRSFL